MEAGFTGGQNAQGIARYGTDIKRESRKAKRATLLWQIRSTRTIQRNYSMQSHQGCASTERSASRPQISLDEQGQSTHCKIYIFQFLPKQSESDLSVSRRHQTETAQD
jgi:hypothetical protein